MVETIRVEELETATISDTVEPWESVVWTVWADARDAFTDENGTPTVGERGNDVTAVPMD